jgi:glycosyltransferase involved in cell wall biosynthesis
VNRGGGSALFCVIPACNEVSRIVTAIQTVRLAGCTDIIIIANGCTDGTEAAVARMRAPDVHMFSFPDPLGFDVPKAIGAYVAFVRGARHVLFYDGDLLGTNHHAIQKMIQSARLFDIDLGLCNCYGFFEEEERMDDLLIDLRRKITVKLGLYRKIGIANPSHGPHIVSRSLLCRVPWRDLAKPPVMLALSARAGLRVDTLASLHHIRLGSAIKDKKHNRTIRETIIGDCLEALCVLENRPRSRVFAGKTYDGYNSRRRFDILEQFLLEYEP